MTIKLHIPRFFSQPYEKTIHKKLKEKSTNQSQKALGDALIKLNIKSSKLAVSLRQLGGIIESYQPKIIESLNQLEALLLKEVQEVIENGITMSDENKNMIANHFELLRTQLVDNRPNMKYYSNWNLAANSLIAFMGTMSAIHGINMIQAGITSVLAGLVLGPLGGITLGLGILILSGVLASIAAYSAYVETRFSAKKQLNDVEDFIQALTNYSDLLQHTQSDKDSEHSTPDATHIFVFNTI